MQRQLSKAGRPSVEVAVCIDCLPGEILSYIFEFLYLGDVRKINTVSKSFLHCSQIACHKINEFCFKKQHFDTNGLIYWLYTSNNVCSLIVDLHRKNYLYFGSAAVSDVAFQAFDEPTRDFKGLSKVVLRGCLQLTSASILRIAQNCYNITFLGMLAHF